MTDPRRLAEADSFLTVLRRGFLTTAPFVGALLLITIVAAIYAGIME